jgi:hypothetical protein
MGASISQDTFMIVVAADLIDAAITLGNISVALRPGFVSIWAWTVAFTYVTGEPPATAFRLNSADGLTGTFSPPSPVSRGSEIRNAILSGTVQIVPGTPGDVVYTGAITILQA